jgi:GTP cyclohydrolase IA
MAQGASLMNRTQANGAKLRAADKIEKPSKSEDGADKLATQAKNNGRAPLEDAVRVILSHIGEDPSREGLRNTPARVAKAYEFLTSGYSKDPKDAINGALFTEEDYQEMILCKDLDFYSLCEHHLLPFMGKAHVAYLPNRKIVGLSKLARMVEIFARRLQVQERMTTQIAQTIMSEIDPLGVAVVLEAEHMCMRMRGVEKQNSYVTTSAMLGVFRTNHETRHEFMQLLRKNNL